mgnify:CR=1 FL=1
MVDIQLDLPSLSKLLGIRLADGTASDSFALVSRPLPLPANGTASDSLQVSTQFGFLCTHKMAAVTDDVTGDAVPLDEALLTVSESVAQAASGWLSRPAPLSSVYGTGQRPYRLGVPGVLTPGATLSVDVQNLTSDPVTVRLVFAGFRVYGFDARGMR